MKNNITTDLKDTEWGNNITTYVNEFNILNNKIYLNWLEEKDSEL